MLLVDDREDRVNHLVEPLKKQGLDVQVTRLDFGDLAFTGRGVGGKKVSIGVELKRLSDALTSLRTGRLSGHQLPGLLGPDGAYTYAWLIIEGEYRTSPTGDLLEFRWDPKRRKMNWLPVHGGMSTAELEKRVLGLETVWGIRSRYTNRPEDTVAFLASLYRHWTDRDQDGHQSPLAPHLPNIAGATAFQTAVMTWPGVGLKVSRAAESTFRHPKTRKPSVRQAANATLAEWANVGQGDRRFGEKRAAALVDFLEGR